MRTTYLGESDPLYRIPLEVYDDHVEYFSKGLVAKGTIAAEQDRYYARWPRHAYKILPGSMKIVESQEQTWKVEFDYDYAVSNDKKTAGSRSYRSYATDYPR